MTGKAVYTLLDLKDGFHQIKIYPEHTKYFAFTTSDGQFEYTRLPFGYSEAPAEFQKRIVQLLRPLIDKDKIIVYIDDVMIPTETVDENLEQVLLLLKRYNLELNFSKCRFLQSKIEYLGYVISDKGIILSMRHTEAVGNFLQPKNTRNAEVPWSFELFPEIHTRFCP